MQRSMYFWVLITVLVLSGSVSATTVLSQGGGAAVPTEATDLLGSWDTILVGYMLPIAAIGVGIIWILRSISQANSSGLIGGVVTAILGVLGTMALPGIITGTGAASSLLGFVPITTSVDPTLYVMWAIVNLGRRYASRRN